MDSGRSPPRYPAIFSLGAFLEARSAALMAAGDPRNIAWYFDDFLNNNNNTNHPAGWRIQAAGSGAGLVTINDEGGGVHQISSGATAASQVYASTESPIIRAVGTTPWYCAHRMKITTAVTAQTTAVGGLVNAAAGTKSLDAGFIGGMHATNLIFQYDGVESGSFINTGVAADTAFHVYEAWSTGDGKMHAALDFGADLGPVTMAAAPVDSCSAQRIIRNGTDAVARIARFDWMAMRGRRT